MEKKNDNRNGNKKRYGKLDGIRGIALLNMIAYHMTWDLVYIYQVDWGWYRSQGAYLWQQGICWTFIFLSGFSRRRSYHVGNACRHAYEQGRVRGAYADRLLYAADVPA